MATNFTAAAITNFSDGWVDGVEAHGSFLVTGAGTYRNSDLKVGDSLKVKLDFGGGITQEFTAKVLTSKDGHGGDKTVTWSLTDNDLAATALAAGLGRTVTATVSAGGTSATSPAASFNYIVCFARGTRLATPSGEVPVEDLAEGDLVLTASGSPSPVKWIGHRLLNVKAYRHAEKAAPVRIRQGAFADNVPHRDLLVSPDHAIYTDGVLVCARQLINGTTIRQDLDCAAVEYFHVELMSHAIVLAEGLPAESYLDTGNRGFFTNGGEAVSLRPDLMDEGDSPTRESRSCAPFVTDGASVRPIWQRLADRSAAIGLPVPAPGIVRDPALHLVAAGRTILPVSSDARRTTFVVPQGVDDVRLRSRAGSPTDTKPWLGDQRRLGVEVIGIVLRDACETLSVPLDHPALLNGWWDVEDRKTAQVRWTDGDALISLPQMKGPRTLEIHVGGSIDYLATATGMDRDEVRRAA